MHCRFFQSARWVNANQCWYWKKWCYKILLSGISCLYNNYSIPGQCQSKVRQSWQNWSRVCVCVCMCVCVTMGCGSSYILCAAGNAIDCTLSWRTRMRCSRQPCRRSSELTLPMWSYCSSLLECRTCCSSISWTLPHRSGDRFNPVDNVVHSLTIKLLVFRF